MGKQICPRYRHHRRAGALQSQEKPRERETNPDSLQVPSSPGNSRLESKQKMSCRAEARTWEKEIAVLPWRSQRLCINQRRRFPLKVEATFKDAVMEGLAQASVVAKSRAWGSACFYDS